MCLINNGVSIGHALKEFAPSVMMAAIPEVDGAVTPTGDTCVTGLTPLGSDPCL
jgi:hypothetical protein